MSDSDRYEVRDTAGNVLETGHPSAPGPVLASYQKSARSAAMARPREGGAELESDGTFTQDDRGHWHRVS